MTVHSKYSPSKISVLMECAGSVQLEEVVVNKEEKSNAGATRGTKLHHYVHRVTTSVQPIRLEDLDVDEKIWVQECVDYYDVLISSFGEKSLYSTFSEEPVSLSSFGLPEVFGTVDKVLYDETHKHLHVIDWKFAVWALISAYKNPQLLTYAGGALSKFKNVDKITLHIVQPTRDHVSTYTLTVHELYEWIHGKLAIAINDSKKTDPCFSPGKDQCQWCNARHDCDARFVWAREEAGRMFQAHKLLPEKITPEAIEEFLETAPLLEQIIKDFRNYVFDYLQKGNVSDKYKIIRGRANRRWKSRKETVKWLTKEKIKDIYVSKLISPAQAEKLNKKLKTSDAFLNLYEVPEGKLSLVVKSHPSEAVKFGTLVDVFKDCLDEEGGDFLG